jgi:hypothetical protein
MAMKEPNRRLAGLIAEASCSRAGLAKRVNQLGTRHGLDLRYDKTAVARWIKDGSQPRGIVPRLVAEVLESRLGRPVTLEELGMGEEEVLPLDVGLAYASTTIGGIEAAADLWRCDVDRRDFLISSAFTGAALIGPSRDWLITPPDEELTGRGERGVGLADVQAVRAMSEMFGRLDNAFGGGHARSAVVQYLNSEAAPMLRGRYSTEVGRQLFAAVAELTLLAGWMAYDTCQHGLAQRYFIQALRLTQTADHAALGAHVLADASNQAAYLGDGEQAVKLARTAKTGARDAATATVRAMLEVREARGHALLGDARACRAALNRAEAVFARSDPASDPAWISFFDEAEMCAQFAYCFRDLHAPAEAERFIDLSLTGFGDDYQRSRAFCQALLATVHVQQHEVEQACEVGSRAITLFTQLRSARGLGYIEDLRRRLEPYQQEPVVREFNLRAAELVGVAA